MQIDTTQAPFPFEYFCLTCISENYLTGSGAANRDWNAAAPLYSSKVIQVQLIDVCVSDMKFTSLHNSYFATGSGSPASTSPDWKLTLNYKQYNSVADLWWIDSRISASHGTAGRQDMFT